MTIEKADATPPLPPPRPVARRAPPPLAEGCAIFLDIDGTLLELAPAPDAVHVDPALATLLPRFGLALAKGARISRKMQGITLGPRYGIPMRLLRAGERAAAVKVTGDIGDLVELPEG